MNKLEALKLIGSYASLSKDEADVLHGIDKRFPKDGSENKAMRWLGFCQGILHERGIFTLEQIKDHSKNKTL